MLFNGLTIHLPYLICSVRQPIVGIRGGILWLDRCEVAGNPSGSAVTVRGLRSVLLGSHTHLHHSAGMGLDCSVSKQSA